MGLLGWFAICGFCVKGGFCWFDVVSYVEFGLGAGGFRSGFIALLGLGLLVCALCLVFGCCRLLGGCLCWFWLFGMVVSFGYMFGFSGCLFWRGG